MRPLGAKNKPKKVSELLTSLEQAAEREGLIFSHSMVEKLLQKEGAIEVNAADKKVVDANNFLNLEIELDEDEVDTYQCGNCDEYMGEKLSACPACGANLSW